MSGPRDERGEDAFDDFFGEPAPSGSTEPLPAEPPPDEQPTQDIHLRHGGPRDESAGAPPPAAPPPAAPQPAAPQPAAPQPAAPQPAAPPAGPARADTAPVWHPPAGAVPEGWWAAESMGPPDSATSHTWHAAPISPPPFPSQHPPPRRGTSPFVLIGLLIGGILLGGLCVAGVVMALGGDEEPVAAPSTVTTTSTQQPTSTSQTSTSQTSTSQTSTSQTSTSQTSTSSSTSSSTTSSSSSSATRSGVLPDGATRCGGALEGTSVGSGTEVTSCAFASAVRDAWLAQEPTSDVRLEVRSPVTNKTYTMSCTGQSVTRCTGGNNAVVFLY